MERMSRNMRELRARLLVRAEPVEESKEMEARLREWMRERMVSGGRTGEVASWV